MPADINLTIPPDALAPLIARVVEATLAQLDGDRAALGDRLAYSEPEAAALLGLQAHQLRDQRLAGRLNFSRGPRGMILYTRDDLAGYLADRREGPAAPSSKRQKRRPA